MPETEAHDPVDNPAHYRQYDHEPIDVIEAWGYGPGFHLGNAIKHIARAPHKGQTLVDLRKALWYVERAVDHFPQMPAWTETLAFEEVSADWKLPPKLSDAVHHLVLGNWVAAHLLIATEIYEVQKREQGAPQ